MDAHTLSLVLALVFACALAVSAAPASNRRHGFESFVSLIGNLRDIKTARNNFPALSNFDGINVARVPDLQELSDREDADPVEDVESLRRGYLGTPSGPLSKRQGAWSYDYGLGGGRFGKRNYGDYGIGGGRFGRDVDHVDLSDGNDTDLMS